MLWYVWNFVVWILNPFCIKRTILCFINIDIGGPCEYDPPDCDVNANCISSNCEASCRCLSGYTGDGYKCSGWLFWSNDWGTGAFALTVVWQFQCFVQWISLIQENTHSILSHRDIDECFIAVYEMYIYYCQCFHFLVELNRDGCCFHSTVKSNTFYTLGLKMLFKYFERFVNQK